MSTFDSEQLHQLEAERLRTRAATAFANAGLGQPPARNYGEAPRSYRLRLVEELKHLSPTWRGLSTRDMLAVAQAGALDAAETTIYQDAVESAQRLTGTLREITETDHSGRKVHRFVGSETAAWAPFQFPVMRGRINRELADSVRR